MPVWASSTGIAAIAFLVLDFAWLSVMGPILYRPQLGDLLSPSVRIAPTVLFYVIYVLVLSLLAIQPALTASNATQALFHGALLGLAAYATYNLTNMATLTRWSVPVALLDTLWGAFLSGVVAWFAARLTIFLNS